WGDANLQAVVLRRQRTGRKWIEGARRIVGLVEIEDRRAVGAQIRVEESCGLVRLFAAGAVAKDEKEPVRPRRHRAEANRLAVQGELHDPSGLVDGVVAELIRDVRVLRGRVLDEASGDAILLVDREPVEPGKRFRDR